MQPSRLLHYFNVMEALVIEEVERQLQTVPLDFKETVNPSQVIAFALNRLPALYATSSEGCDRQQQKAKSQFANQIYLTVRLGFVVVQRDPFKKSTSMPDLFTPNALITRGSYEQTFQHNQTN